jgi:hypothetical protein
LHEVASVQGKLGNLLRVDHGAHRGAGAFDQRSLTLYLDDFGHLSYFQDDIDLGVLIHLQRHPGLLKFLEALQFDAQVVSARSESRHAVLAHAITRGHPPETGIGIYYRHSGAGNCTPVLSDTDPDIVALPSCAKTG